MHNTETLEYLTLDLRDEGFEVLKHYLEGTDILKSIEVTDTGDFFENEDIEGDKYTQLINNGTEGAWRE